MSIKAGKPFLKLVQSFSDITFRYPYSIQLSSDNEPDGHRDVAFINALRFYVHQKTKELGIDDYRVFVENEQMGLHFLCADDRQNFEDAFENRAHQEMTILLDIPGKLLRFQLEDVARALNGLARQFGVDENVDFTVTPQGIEMQALGRDSFVTFFQEYAYVKDRVPFQYLSQPAAGPVPVL